MTFRVVRLLPLLIVDFVAARQLFLPLRDPLLAFPEADFEGYAKAHAREYRHGSEDFALRRELFLRTAERVREHNAKPDRRWSASINAFSDRTAQELAQLRGWRHQASSATSQDAVSLVRERLRTEPSAERPSAIDWRNLTSTKRIADQGECGSCWAMATASMLESRHEVHTNTFRTFSAQRLVDCVPNPKECGGSGGCGGATVELALTYIQGLSGARLVDAEDAPYKGVEQHCTAPAATETSLLESESVTGHYGVTNWETLPSNKASPLMAALLDGPVAVAASAELWFMYYDGIFDSCEKDSVIDHAVVMVGYGSESKTGYWTIRNSWGEDWGEHGHIRLLRHDTTEEDDKFCGVDHRPGEGMACKPYPKSVVVCGMCGVLYDSVVADFGSTAATTK